MGIRNKEDMVLILFKDHTWFVCYPEQIKDFLMLNNNKYVIIKDWDVNQFFNL